MKTRAIGDIVIKDGQMVGAISGGMDPIHSGHINMINEAKQLCDVLILILNNDNWLKNKKGYVFMNEIERVKIAQSIKGIDGVIITSHKENDEDMSVCNELEKIRPDFFFNGGDRKSDNIPEYDLCNKLGIKMIFNVGGEKTQSSSELVRRVSKNDNNRHKRKR